ncbi:Shedu anti-phage system protein SduA domain-containing protein [Citrobacter meridianamericanus]
MNIKIKPEYIHSIERLVCELFLDRIKEKVASDKEFDTNIPRLLKEPSEVTLFWFRNHLAIAFGDNSDSKDSGESGELKFSHRFFLCDDDTYIFSAVTNHEFEKEDNIDPLMAIAQLCVISGQVSQRGFLFSGQTFQELIDLGWRIEVFNSTGILNGFKDIAMPKNKYVNFQNIFLFYKNIGGDVVSHHIKWLEVFPCKLIIDSSGNITELLSSPKLFDRAIVNAGCHKFFIPETYQQLKFRNLNAFIELWGNKGTDETTITRFLKDDENKFILTMQFGVKDIYPELICPEINSQRGSIRPDFFIKKTNDICDIVEFKLPRLKKPIVVGNKNRRKFSSFFSTYLAQAKAYVRYFSNVNNRDSVYKLHGLQVENPKVTIVVGRRCDINTAEIREMMSEHADINLISYDDLVDAVVAQLYM